MPMTVVEDDKGFYHEYTNALRERSEIQISVYSDSARPEPEIANALQDLFTTEVVKLGHDALRARGVSPDLLDESDQRSSLDGVALPPEDRRILEAKVRLLAGQVMLPGIEGDGGWEPPEDSDGGIEPPQHHAATGAIKQAVHNVGSTCICMTTGIPGITQSLSSVNLTTLPATIAFGLGRFYLGSDKWIVTDWLRLLVESGAAWNIAPDQMQVGLASEVNWWKSIRGWSLCRGTTLAAIQMQKNPTPYYFGLNKGCNGADTIVFSKAATLGFMTDVANLDRTQFWTLFGGKRLTFTWVVD